MSRYRTYTALISRPIPGGNGGFDLSIRGCAQERDRAIGIAKDADERIIALEDRNRRLSTMLAEVLVAATPRLEAALEMRAALENAIPCMERVEYEVIETDEQAQHIAALRQMRDAVAAAGGSTQEDDQ